MATRTVSVRLVADIGSFVSGMTRAGASATGFGNIAGKALGAAGIAGGFAMAIGKASEFESAMSGVQAATMESASVMEDLRAAILKAGADSQYSAKEAADAVTAMAKAGVSAADIMGGGLTGALDLAAAGQLEVAEAAEIASVAMTQFNLAGEDLPHVADLLAAGAGKAMGSVEDMGQALNQAGLVASATGLSIEETTGTLAAFASAGLVGSDAGTSFRSMLQRLQNPSKESAQKLSELGIAMYDANGEFVGMESLAGQLQTQLSGMTQATRDQAMAQIFGSDAVRAANVLYTQGASGIADWTNKVNDSGYAAEQAATLTDNLAGDLERLGGSLDTLLITAGEGSQGPLRLLVQMLGGLVDGVAWAAEAFGSLPGPVMGAVVAIAAFVALRGPLAAMLTAIQVRAVLATSAFLGMAFSATALTTALLGLPLIGVAVGIGKAVTEVVDFTNAGDDAQTMVADLKASLEGMSGEEKFAATSAGVKQLRGELAKFEEIVSGYEDQGWFDKYIWQNPFDDLTDVKDAKESLGVLEAAIAELEGQGTTSFAAIGATVRGAGEVIAGAVGGVGGAVDSTVEQLEAAQVAQEEWLTGLQEIGTAFVEPLASYKTLLDEKTAAEREAAEATAAATDSAEDSWEDYVTDVDVSLDELATRLEEQLLAQDNWRANLATITQRGGLEVGQILAAMGQEGVELTAKMADGTDAEFNRMADLLIEDARRGGAGAAAALDTEMKVLATVGAGGAKSTVQGIARELGIGVGEVARIAAQYGLNLASGVNPILSALGRPNVRLSGRNGFNTGGGYAEGGYTGPGGKYQPAGIVHAGEFVFTQEQVRRLGKDQLEAIANRGYATGGFVSAASVPRPRSTSPYRPPISTGGDAAMQKGFDEVRAWLEANAGGLAGSGAVGGKWTSLWHLVKAAIPAARINSTYRPGDPGYHGRNKAIDFGYGTGPGGAGSAGLASINRLLHDRVGRNLAELIYDGIGDDRPDLKNGRPLTYSAATRNQHRNHVHAAVYDQGGPLHPGLTLAYNGTGKTEWVSREFSGAGGRGGGGGGIDYERLAAAIGRGNVVSVSMPASAGPDEVAGAIVHRLRVADLGGRYAWAGP